MYLKTADVAGLKIFYREAGDPSKPTIVLLHGFPSSSYQFHGLMPRLEGQFHVIAPDYPGMGFTEAPARPSCDRPSTTWRRPSTRSSPSARQGHSSCAYTTSAVRSACGSRPPIPSVYITHGHGDHWFGLGVIRERYPKVRAVATVRVVEHMRSQVSPRAFSAFWESRFPGQIQRDVTVAEPLYDSRFELEGHELAAVEVGHTDTDDTTVLHVPSIGLVVAGDVAYNDVHVYLDESDHDRRLEWIRALDTVEALQSRAVVAGHKRAGRPDDPTIIEETRAYIRDFDGIAGETNTAEELYGRMLSAYPSRVNPGALWSSARALNE